MEEKNNMLDDLAFIRQVMQDGQRLAQCSPFSAFLWGAAVILGVVVSRWVGGRKIYPMDLVFANFGNGGD